MSRNFQSAYLAIKVTASMESADADEAANTIASQEPSNDVGGEPVVDNVVPQVDDGGGEVPAQIPEDASQGGSVETHVAGQEADVIPVTQPQEGETNVSQENNTIEAVASAPVDATEQGEEGQEVDHKAIEEVTESPVLKYDTSESPEALSTRVQAEMNVVKEGETEIENAVKAVDDITKVALEAHALISENGKIDPVQAILLNIALEQACLSLPSDMRDIDMPSMESFKDNGFLAAEVSLEGVMDKLSTAIDNVGISFQKTIKNGLGLIGSWTPLLERLKKRAEGFRDAIDGSNREDGLKTVKFRSAKTLTVDGKLPEPETVIKTVALYDTLAEQLLSPRVDDAFIAFIKSTTDVLKEGSVDEKDMGEASFHGVWSLQIKKGTLPDIFKLIPALKNNASGAHGITSDELEFKKSDPLFGNTVMVGMRPRSKSNTSTDKVEYSSNVTIERTGGLADGKELTTLTSGQQKQVIDLVIKLLDYTIQYWKSFKQRNQKVAEAYQYAHKANRDVINSHRWFARDAGQFVKVYTRVTKWGLYDARYEFMSHARAVIPALLDYVDQSTKATKANVAGQSGE